LLSDTTTRNPEVFMQTLASLRSTLVLSLTIGALAVGCTAGENVDLATQQLASDGASALSASDQGTIGLSAGALEAATSADPVQASASLVAAPPDPGDAGCRTRVHDPNDPSTVIITLHDCTGLFGRRHVSGTEIVHFTPGANGILHADLQSEDLTVDGLPASHTASADITFDGSMRHVAWQGSWQGTSEQGDAVSHTSELTIDVDTAAHCRTRSGTGVTTVGGRQIDSTITDVKVCRDASGDAGCPTGSVVHTRTSTGKQVSVVFDGTAEAEVTGPRRRTFAVPLVCGQ
jgi:hypothetical protein